MSGQLNIYEMITDRIITMLEKGTIPWHKPWNGDKTTEFPMNLASKREYRGINVFLLMAMDRTSRYWLSFKQAQERGGHVRNYPRGLFDGDEIAGAGLGGVRGLDPVDLV